MQDKNLIALFNLSKVPGLGPQTLNNLVDSYRNCDELFEFSAAELCKVKGVTLQTAQNIIESGNGDWGRSELDRCYKFRVRPVTRWDEDYPALLLKINCAPPYLYTRGKVLDKRFDGIAVVGTRKPTPYGRAMAEKVTRGIIEMGCLTVSGLARGIDTIAHRTSIENNGSTVAVLGNSLDRIYPPENRELADLIEEKGCLISEFPFGTKPERVNFPLRNRIISGLSHGVAVIEAGNKSGAILTALNAVDQNREVFALPGRVTDKESIGCNRLIKNGAIPLLNIGIIKENVKNRLFHPIMDKQAELGLDISREEADLLQFISGEALSVEEIERKGEFEYRHLLTLLLELELKGLVRQVSGGLYIRT